MLTLKECQQIVYDQLNKIVFPGEPANLYDPIRYILEPDGKRIRPSLVLLGCNIFSDNIEEAVFPAIAIEVFHNFTLMHDDIMDCADTRRNRPAVHVRWNQNIAILSGDAMLIKAYEFLARTSSVHFPEILMLFNRTALDLCEGQQYDMDFENASEINTVNYIKMVELKTAALLATSLKIGAIIGGAGADKADLLYEFGRNIGIAFQLQDDLMDVFADPSVFGKQTGNDIVSNKKTVLLVLAMSLSRGKTRQDLLHWITQKNFDRAEKIGAMTAIFNAMDLEQKTRASIRHYYNEAMVNLETLEQLTGRCGELIRFSETLLNRKK